MDEVLRVRDVRRISGLSRSTIWRLERQGKFPIKLSARIVGWRASDVQTWIRSRER